MTKAKRRTQRMNRQTRNARPFGCESLEDRRMLATFNVTTFTDVVDAADGVLSLREAVMMSSSNNQDDTIVLQSASLGTYSLMIGGSGENAGATGDLDIGSDNSNALTIRGPADRARIGAGALGDRVFDTLSGADVVLENLIILNGNANNEAGGGIRNRGDLAIVNSIVDENSTNAAGGGISSADGLLTVVDSTISENTAGDSGGGIYVGNFGTFSITRTEISRNSAAAAGGGFAKVTSFARPHNGGSGATSLITNSTVSGNESGAGGGGLLVEQSSLSLELSNVLGNSAAYSGGGIYNRDANVTVIDTQVSGNTAVGSGLGGGGGIYSDNLLNVSGSTISNNIVTSGEGGGIRARFGTLAVDQSTISNNSASSAGGGISAADGGIDVSISHTTIAENTGSFGALFAFGADLDVDHSVVANNTKTSGSTTQYADLDFSGGGSQSLDYSLVESGEPVAGTGNVTGADPLLGSLADNGGPTPTHALLVGSPAINAGDPGFSAPPNFDQRGAPFVRVADGGIDIGAYERQTLPPSFFVVTTLVDELDYTNSDVSLREAINSAEHSVGTETITFQAGLTGTITLSQGELAIGDAMTIQGPGPSTLTIDADGQSRIFNVDDGDTSGAIDVTISALTLTGGVAGSPAAAGDAKQGGAIFSVENLTVRDSQITGNRAYLEGGGIHSGSAYTFSSGTALTVINSAIRSNRADFGDGFNGRGGGIANRVGPVTIIDSTVDSNTAVSTGGGIIVLSGNTLTVSNGTISDNSARSGGGITNSDGTLEIDDSDISDNAAGSYGGGIYNQDGPANISNTVISGNEAASGGGLYNGFSADATTLTNSNVNNNEANRGGGIFSNTEASVVNSTLSGNTAGLEGGAILNAGDLALSGSTLSGNLADKGAGVFTDSDMLMIANSTISGNNGSRGVGIYAYGAFSDVAVSNSTITANQSNTATEGAVEKSSATSTFSLTNTIVSANTDSVGNQSNLVGSGFAGDFNLVGSGATVAGADNISSDVPQLDALANNGGPTETHALLPGSPAIDAGDPAAVAGMNGVPEFDQRGMGFLRVVGGRIDMGAFEVQTLTLACDFNDDDACDGDDIDDLQDNIVTGPPDPGTYDLTGDGMVTIADRDEWLALAGAENLASGNPYLLGDATLDGVVDGQDFIAWNNNKFSSTSAWTGGDFTVDGVVDGQDFIIWNNNKFQTADTAMRTITPQGVDQQEEQKDRVSILDELFGAYA